MKHFLLNALAMIFAFSVMAQNNRDNVQSRLSTNIKNQKKSIERPLDPAIIPTRAINPTVISNRASMVETIIGQTTYDLQSNYGTVGNRVHRAADGTISVVWTKGDSPFAYPDRGMGYNFWNGFSWGPIPTFRQETYRTGWPNIGVTSTGGEIVVNHGTNPTNIHTRATKGTGAWTSSVLGTTTITWPRMVVGGANGNSVHVIGQPNAAPYYNFYSRSTDGGATWVDENLVLPNFSNYLFKGSTDGYDIDSRGDIVAIVVGGFSESLVLYKSTDNGATWSTTVINQFPLAPWDFNTSNSDINGDGLADTIPTTDSGISCVIDNNNVVHVVTGSTRILCEVSPDVSYFPGTDGLLYWNETMPAGDITNNIIAMAEDIDGSGVIELAPNIATYQCGLSGMPSLGIDVGNNIHLVYSSIIENTTNGNPDPAWEESYRNSYYMYSSNNGMNWSFPIRLNPSDFDEMVWPMIPKNIGSTVDIFYYKDGEPGNTFQPSGNPDAPAPYDIIHTPQPNLLNSIIVNSQPPALVGACTNGSLSISVSATGNSLTYQWQRLAPGGTIYSNVTFGGINSFSGASSNTLNIGNVTGLDGYIFRCKITDINSTLFTNPSTLNVGNPVSILNQPFNVSVCTGLTSTFSLNASGNGLTYQWQYGINTSSFTNISNGGVNAFSGSNSNSLIVGNPSGLDNYYFRCVVNSSICSSPINSNNVQLFVAVSPSIISQPTNFAACPNQIANFSLTAAGPGVNYQWQFRSGTSGLWTDCSNGAVYTGATTNALIVSNTTGLNNYQYRCVLSNICPQLVYSNIVYLTVYTTPASSITVDGSVSNPTTISLGDVTSLALNGSINSSNPNITWTPATGLSSSNSTNPLAYPSTSTNYTATFTNTFGCTQSVSQQINVNSLPNNGGISITSASGLSNIDLFDTIKVRVQLNNVNDIYAVYARLKYYGGLAPYLTYVGYYAGSILGTGSAVISTPPVASGTNGYDFGISKIGAVPGYNGTGTFYTFLFRPVNVPASLLGSQVCFYVDNLSITNASSGISVGLVNQGPYCFGFTSLQANVWPGDLDNNKAVNTADILKIGIFYNSTGSVRNNASLQWVAQPSTLWGTNTSSPNSDGYKVFVDGNGDGLINNADQTSVGFNMGKIHQFTAPLDSILSGNGTNKLLANGDLNLIASPSNLNGNQLPQQMEIQVNLSNTGGALNNLYGVSFDLSIDTNMFDLQSTTFDYNGSIFGLQSLDFLNIEYVSNGVVSVGMTRFNNPSINGNGLLCKIRMNTKPTVTYPDTTLILQGIVIAANDSLGNPYAINPASLLMPYNMSTGISVPNQEINGLSLYPNPNTGTFNIRTDLFLNESYQITDLQGRILMSGELSRNETTLIVDNLSQGVYVLKLLNNPRSAMFMKQ